MSTRDRLIWLTGLVIWWASWVLAVLSGGYSEWGNAIGFSVIGAWNLWLLIRFERQARARA